MLHMLSNLMHTDLIRRKRIIYNTKFMDIITKKIKFRICLIPFLFFWNFFLTITDEA